MGSVPPQPPHLCTDVYSNPKLRIIVNTKSIRYTRRCTLIQKHFIVVSLFCWFGSCLPGSTQSLTQFYIFRRKLWRMAWLVVSACQTFGLGFFFLFRSLLLFTSFRLFCLQEQKVGKTRHFRLLDRGFSFERNCVLCRWKSEKLK